VQRCKSLRGDETCLAGNFVDLVDKVETQ
jgi:hypothetical protein